MWAADDTLLRPARGGSRSRRLLEPVYSPSLDRRLTMPPKQIFQLISPRGGQRAEPGLHSERRSRLAAGATAMVLTVHRVLAGYAVALACASLIYYADDKIMWAAVCDGMAVVVIICSILANVGSAAAPKKGDHDYVRWMVGIHIGMLLPPGLALGALAAAYFGLVDLSNMRLWTAFTIIVLCSALASFYIFILLRPRKEHAAQAGGLV